MKKKLLNLPRDNNTKLAFSFLLAFFELVTFVQRSFKIISRVVLTQNRA